jgi:hypothetical protein
MSSTHDAKTPAARQYVDYDEYVDFQIEKARAHIKATDIFTTVTLVTAVFVGYLLLFVVCDQWILDGGFSGWTRGVLLTVVLTVLGTLLVRRVVLPLIRRVHPLYAARMLERSDPNLQSNLLNFVDVREGEGVMPAAVVLRSMQKRAAVELSHIDVDEAIDRRPLLRVAYLLLIVVVLSALYIVFSPKDPFTSVRRALLPASAVAVATETTIADVTPGDDQVPARTLLTVEADVRGRDADRVQILFTTADNKYVDQPVEMRRLAPDLPRFRGILNGENGRGLLQSLTYSISAGDARSRPFHIDVIQPPSARVDHVDYTFPDYMKLSRRTSDSGDIEGWEGATVILHARANLPVKSAMVVMTDSENPHAKGEEILMQVADETKLSATWKLEFRADGTFPRFYHIQVKTAKGETDPEPAVHTLRIHPDQRPDVTLLFPTGSLVGERGKAANAKIPLVIQAADPDFELRSITLKAERNGEELVNERLFETAELGQSYRGEYDWDLGKLKLAPRDRIQFWIEARDNKHPIANRAVTPRLDLEIIDRKKSAEQVQRELASEKEQQADQLARADTNKGSDREDFAEQEPAPDEPPAGKPPAQEKPAANPPPDKAEPPTEKPRDAKPDDAKPDAKDPSQGEPPGDRPESPPPAHDFQKTLEKLLKQSEEEKKPPEERADQQPPEGSEKSEGSEKGGQQQKPGNDGKQGAKPDQKNAGKSAAKSDENGSGKPGEKPGSGNAKPPQSPPDGKRPGQDNPPPNGTGKTEPKKQSPGKSGALDKADSQNPSASPADENPKPEPKQNERGDSEKGASEKSEAGKNPQRDPADETQKDPSQSEPKQDGDSSGKKGDKGAGDKPGEEKSGTNKSGKKDPADGKPDEPKPGDGKSGETGAGEKGSGNPEPGKKSDGDKPDGDKSDGEKADGRDGKADDAASEKAPKKSTDPASDGAAKENDPLSDGEGERGKPGPASSASKNEKPGEAEGDGAKSKSDSGSGKESKSDGSAGGKEEPADESPDATKKQADGTEKGDATGSDEDAPNAPKSNDVKRKPGSKPGKTKPSDNPDSEKKNSAEPRSPKDGASGRTDDAEDTTRQPDGKNPTEQPGKTDDPPSEKPDRKRTDDAAQRPGEPPEAGNQKPRGPGRKQGQKSDQPQGGEEGESAASDQGQKGANKEGPGDRSGQPGDSEKSRGEAGNPGGKPKDGSKSSPSDDGSGSKTGSGEKPGAGEGKADGEGEGKPSEDSTGKPSGKSSESSGGKGSSGKPSSESASSGKSGGQSSEPGAAPNSQNASSSQGSGVNAPPSGADTADSGGTANGSPLEPRPRKTGESAPSPEEEEARLEYARKASNLLLKRLKKQLERGEIDQQLLDEMGWKDIDDVRNFTNTLEENLRNTGDDTSDAGRARRLRFEELLKSLDTGRGTERRQGGGNPERRVRPTTVRNVPVPPEYRQQQENYTKRLSKQRGAGNPKPAGAKPSK